MCYGPEMISKALRKWVAKAGAQIQYIAPGSPWENGYCESFNGKLCQRAPKSPQLWAFKIPWPAGSVRIGDQPAV